jgi:hypothetical protein
MLSEGFLRRKTYLCRQLLSRRADRGNERRDDDVVGCIGIVSQPQKTSTTLIHAAKKYNTI